MADTRNDESFEAIVEWAYSTLPPKIRDLPDFPGIQVVDEPPSALRRKKWLTGKEMLGLFSGIHRTQQRHDDVRIAPNLIFVFRGPILRCSKGDLRAEVKRVVWHEVAHWLGHNEEEVKELGLSTLSVTAEDATHHPLEIEASKVSYAPDAAEEANEQQLRCMKCYSADVTCRELDKPLTSTAGWLSDPLCVPARMCKCNSCGYEWDDEDNT